MKPLFIEGIGILTARGRGISRFETALQEGWQKPSFSAEGRPSYRVAPGDMTDSEVLKLAKRADRFSKMSVLAASDAVMDSGAVPADIAASTGVIVATALGAHATIFKFLDGIIDYGDTGVSPTTFAHSIHNAAASYLTGVLGCKGPAVTVTDFYFPFQQSLLLAYAWLVEKRAQHVLVGLTDESSSAMDYIFDEKFRLARDGRMKPCDFSEKPVTVPGEGSVFFLLTLDPSRKKYGAFSGVEIGKQFKGWEDAGLSVIGANGMAGSEKIYESFTNKPVEAYSDIYGGFMASGAFDCAAAALMLKRQRCPASVSSPAKSGEAPESVQCIAHDPCGNLAFVKIEK